MESNYISGNGIVSLLEAINVHQTVTELRVTNQVRMHCHALIATRAIYYRLKCNNGLPVCFNTYTAFLEAIHPGSQGREQNC